LKFSGSSMAAVNDVAMTAPTPGIGMSSLQGALKRAGRDRSSRRSSRPSRALYFPPQREDRNV
jgi:hypothetical protein